MILAVAFTLGTGVYAQEKKETKPAKMEHSGMKDCVMMKDGKMMVMKGGKTGMMDKDMTMKNGATVMKDGTVKMKDGKTMMMKEGDMMDMSGKMEKMKTEKPTHK